MTGRNSRLFYLTRNLSFVCKVAGSILGLFILCSALVVWLRGKPVEGSSTTDLLSLQAQLNFPTTAQMDREYERLRQSPSQSPNELASWLRDVEANQTLILLTENEKPAFDRVTLRIGRWDIQSLISQHAEAPDTALSFQQYARWLFSKPTDQEKAAQELALLAKQEPPPQFANEFFGRTLLKVDAHPAALEAFLREIQFHPNLQARNMALQLAIQQDKKEQIRAALDGVYPITSIHSTNLRLAAKKLKDVPLLIRAHLLLEKERWSAPFWVGLALFTGSIWYFALIYSGPHGRGNSWRLLPALFLGIFSVWALQWLQDYTEYARQTTDLPTVTHELLNWILYVGLPEEAIKLLFFIPLLPWVLRARSDTYAALAAGVVGLGFALEENLGYFASSGEAVAFPRLITANFLHTALTGCVGWAFFDLVRSRFHRATEFMTVFALACVAHGVYNFASSQSHDEVGYSILPILILALSTKFYFQRLQPGTNELRRIPISRTFVFLCGSALICGVTILSMVIHFPVMEYYPITFMLRIPLTLAPVMVMYVREFKEV